MILLTTFVLLITEIQRFNALLSRMRVSIKNLRRALAGEVGMSSELDDVSWCLYNGHLPGNGRDMAVMSFGAF